MLFFDSPFLSPYDNLALEEHLFATLPEGESALLLWQNDNTIVVGKNQNAAAEVNTDYVAAHHIRVARRLSGGGAVYHDLGNLNFTIITPQAQFDAFHFKIFVTPVLETLASFGLTGAFTGRNDITLNGKKICGNAQYNKGKKLLHHGCIMLSTDLSQVGKALCVNQKKFETKAVKSVASRVTTINAEAQTPITMAEFKEQLRSHVFADTPMQEYTLSAQDMGAIQTLSREKYATHAWIYQNTPAHTLQAEQRFGWGLVQVSLQVKQQQIEAVQFFGDFFDALPTEALSAQLVGASLDESLLLRLEQIDVTQHLQGSTPSEIYQLLLSAICTTH